MFKTSKQSIPGPVSKHWPGFSYIPSEDYQFDLDLDEIEIKIKADNLSQKN